MQFSRNSAPWRAPQSWTKYGEIFNDEQKRIVFVCVPCSSSSEEVFQRFDDLWSFEKHIQICHLACPTPSLTPSPSHSSSASSSTNSTSHNLKRCATETLELAAAQRPVSPKMFKTENEIITIDLDDDDDDYVDVHVNHTDKVQQQIVEKLPSKVNDDILQPTLEQAKLGNNPLIDKSLKVVLKDCREQLELLTSQSVAHEERPTEEILENIITLDDTEDDDEKTKLFEIKNKSYTEELYKLKLAEISAKKTAGKQLEIKVENSTAPSGEPTLKNNGNVMEHSNINVEDNIEPLKSKQQKKDDNNWEMKHWKLEDIEQKFKENTEHLTLEYSKAGALRKSELTMPNSASGGIYDNTESVISNLGIFTKTEHNMEQSINDIEDHENENLFCIARESSVDEYHRQYDYIELSDDDVDIVDDDDDEEGEGEEENNNADNTVEQNLNTKPTALPSDSLASNPTNKPITGYIVRCGLCFDTFENGVDFMKHKKLHEANDETKIHNLIPTPEALPSDIQNYITRFVPLLLSKPLSPMPSFSSQVSADLNETQQTVEISQHFKCRFCPKTFSAFWQSQNHQKAHEQHILRQLSVLMRKKEIDAAYPYKCNECGKRTKSEKAQQKHQIRFHGPAPHTDTEDCEICKKRILKNYMPQHIAKHNNTHPTFTCLLCEVSHPYRQKQSLFTHMRKMHPNVNLQTISDGWIKLHRHHRRN